MKEWKLNAYYKFVTFGLFPLLIPLTICFAYFKIWYLFSLVIGIILVLILSCYFIKKRLLMLSVNIALAGATLSTFFYLHYIHNVDGLYFMVFMIIIAGIFLGKIEAFIWAFIQIGFLLVTAFTLVDFTIFPKLPEYFDKQNNGSDASIYLSTFIFLYIASAFLSILFQRYFTDLFQKIKQSQNEKILLESELIQAQKLELIGTLASGIAHEFGHGLTSIKSCANLILKKSGQQNNELKKYTQNIHNTCNLINESTGKLLSFARKKHSEMSIVNVHDVIESVVNLLSYMLDKNINIKNDLKSDHSVVRGNFSQLQSVFMNLAVNANDAMVDGGLLKFTTKPVAFGLLTQKNQTDYIDQTNCLAVEVSDTGSGIDASIKENIFKPFFTTKEQNKGTGLGLSIVERIVKDHNGKIEVSSEKGKGTTFTIYLPLVPKPIRMD